MQPYSGEDSIRPAEGVVRADRIFTYEDREDLPIYARQLSASDAHDLQMHLLPTRPPEMRGFAFDAVSMPAALVGGDHFNFLAAGGDRLGVLIFDVSGKGPEAALVAAQLRSIFRVQAWGNRHVKDVLTRANDFLSYTLPPGRFATVLYGILDPARRRFSFARAGHEPLALIRDGRVETLAPFGLPLGIATHEEFADLLDIVDLPLKGNDRLFFFTDGLTEARNAEADEFGLDRIVTTLCTSQGSDVDAMIAAVEAFVADEPPHDDLTMISVRVLS